MHRFGLSEDWDAWQGYRNYLRVLARQGIAQPLQGKLDESDVAQEVLLLAFKKRSQFRGDTQQELLAWMRQILVNHLKQMHRRFSGGRDVSKERSIHAAVERSSMCLGQSLVAKGATPSQIVAKREDAAQAPLKVAQALQELSENQRMAVELHYLQGLTFSEVGERMGVNSDQVAGYIRRGLSKLRKNQMG